MKQLLLKNKIPLIGAGVGMIAGFFYWKFIGCSAGTCMITSNPLNSTVYFGVMGYLIFSLFRK